MDRSRRLFERAKRTIPGGVNSPVRAFAAVGGDPRFIARGEGNELVDVDGRRYLDFVGSWGPLLFGHADPDVVEAATAAIRNGSSFGAPTEGEVLFAEELCQAHPVLEQVRLCSSGTEATMHALRLARGFTGRDFVLKIDGCFHGAHDAVLVAAGSGVVTYARPGSPGIPAAVAGLTLTAPFNDLDTVRKHLSSKPVAALIVEPVPGNMGCVAPDPGYLEGLRVITQEYGTLLILDEVMTGFRLARGGACERFGVSADLVTLGKICGAGFPLAAFGGRAEIMGKLSPAGPVYQAGTLSGNPVAVAAGRAVLKKLRPEVYQRLDELGAGLEEGIGDAVRAAGACVTRVGSMFTIYFRPTAPRNFEEVKDCDLGRFAMFHQQALDRGVYLPPSQFEAAFIPATLTDAELAKTVDVIRAVL